MNHFKLSEDEIREIQKDFGFSKVNMGGFHKDLLKVKTDIEKTYSSIFSLCYALGDAPYHGWSGESLKEMRAIEKEIDRRLKEIYAIVLSATGTDIE